VIPCSLAALISVSRADLSGSPKEKSGSASTDEARRQPFPDARFIFKPVDVDAFLGGADVEAAQHIYVALGAFSAATLVTLLGAVLGPFQGAIWFRVLVGLGLVLGFGGVGGLVFGSVSLFQATQLSLTNIRKEAALIRERQSQRITRLTDRAVGEPGGKT
jgi:hypothetical protein